MAQKTMHTLYYVISHLIIYFTMYMQRSHASYSKKPSDPNMPADQSHLNQAIQTCNMKLSHLRVAVTMRSKRTFGLWSLLLYRHVVLES